MTREANRRSEFWWKFWAWVIIICAVLWFCVFGKAQTSPFITLTGAMQISSGQPAANYSLQLTLTPQGALPGLGLILNSTTACATSSDGTVVGIPNPRTRPVAAASYAGTLPAGTYYVTVAFRDAVNNFTLPGPEAVVQLTAPGAITVAPPPTGIPASAALMSVFIGTASGAETLQGQTAAGTYTQSQPLVSNLALPVQNLTTCRVYANDALTPVGSYQVSLIDFSGNAVPGYPMNWQLLGPGTTINLSNGVPVSTNFVRYPAPVLQQPTSNATQYIAGGLNLNGYNLGSVGKIGIGKSTPGYAVDAVGAVNVSQGFLFGGVAAANTVLLGNGSFYVPSSTIPASMVSGLMSTGYRTVANGGINLTQRTLLNFSGALTAADDAGNSRTNVTLSNTGVTPGSYSNPTFNVGSDGRITSASSGATGTNARVCNGNGCYFRQADGTIFAWGVVTGNFSGNTQLNVAITFPVSFTSTPSLIVGVGGQPNGNDDSVVAYHKNLNVNGATAIARCATNIGGSGCSNSSSSLPIHWHAMGY